MNELYCKIGRLLCPDIFQFHCACLRTEIRLRELTLSRTLNPNPKSCRSVDPQFSHNCYFMFTSFTTIFFIVKRYAWMKTRGCITQMTNPCEPVSTFNKRPFCSNHFELCNLTRAGRKQHIRILRRYR